MTPKYPGVVHPWTVAWFETLPQSYQTLDAVQLNPVSPPWDGLTRLPFDLTTRGGWTIQEETAASLTIMQSFRAAPGQRMHVQLWGGPGSAPGGSVSVYAWNTETTSLLTLTGTSEAVEVNTPVELSAWFYPPASGLFTIAVVTQAATGVVASLPVVEAVNVSRRLVEKAELPHAEPSSEATTYPLLRFMDGIGQIGGQYRDTSDKLWDGYYTNPATCPDGSLRWLAQMAGIHRNVYQRLELADLRALITATVARGLTALGSRASLSDVVRPYLSGDKYCIVSPHPTKAHTIVIRVKFTEVPGNDLPALADNIRATGIIPAGHVIELAEAAVTWDQWEAAAGTSWNELEAQAPRWAEFDIIGLPPVT